MTKLTIFLPDSTERALAARATSIGADLAHYCANVLTDFIADDRGLSPLNQKAHNGGISGANEAKPEISIPTMELIRQIILILRDEGGSARKPDVEKALFEKNKNEFSKPYWQAPVGEGIPRWKKNAQFARLDARKMGLIKATEESGHGVWELTDKGRRWQLD